MLRTQRVPGDTSEALTGVIIPSILPDGSFYREPAPDNRLRENGRDFYTGAVIVQYVDRALDGFATVDAFRAAFPIEL